MGCLRVGSVLRALFRTSEGNTLFFIKLFFFGYAEKPFFRKTETLAVCRCILVRTGHSGMLMFLHLVISIAVFMCVVAVWSTSVFFGVVFARSRGLLASWRRCCVSIAPRIRSASDCWLLLVVVDWLKEGEKENKKLCALCALIEHQKRESIGCLSALTLARLKRRTTMDTL